MHSGVNIGLIIGRLTGIRGLRCFGLRVIGLRLCLCGHLLVLSYTSSLFQRIRVGPSRATK